MIPNTPPDGQVGAIPGTVGVAGVAVVQFVGRGDAVVVRFPAGFGWSENSFRSGEVAPSSPLHAVKLDRKPVSQGSNSISSVITHKSPRTMRSLSTRIRQWSWIRLT